MLKSTYIFIISLLYLSSLAQAQTSLSGYVKDTFGKGIESATVSVIGTDTRTSTDVDGFYKLKIASQQNLKIEVTSVGYITQSILLKSNETYKDFQLKK